MMTDGNCATWATSITIGDTYGSAGQRIAVMDRIVHPDFHIMEYYFGIIILEEEITTAKNHRMKILIDSEIPRENDPVRIAARGITDQGDGNSDNLFIHQIDLPVLSKEQCKLFYGPINVTSRFCAGYFNRKCEICRLDGGSPVFQYDKSGNPVAVGMSIELQCGEQR